MFILHRLRNKFLQLMLISLDSASWELHQYSRRMCGPMKNPKVETRSRDSNSGPQDARSTLYLTTTDTTQNCLFEQELFPHNKIIHLGFNHYFMLQHKICEPLGAADFYPRSRIGQYCKNLLNQT